MPIHLYRSVRWFLRGMGTVRLHAGIHYNLSTKIKAPLIALRLATKSPFTICGEPMTDDRSTALILITPPASEPLTLAEAKVFLRIEHAADDALITRAVAAAREAAEHYLRCALLPQTWEYIVAIRIAARCDCRLVRRNRSPALPQLMPLVAPVRWIVAATR